MSHNSVFGSRLRESLKSRGITQQQIASELGLTRQGFARYLDGSSAPNLDALTIISRRLEVSTDYLLGLSDIASPDVSTQIASKVTGLSEKAIDNLRRIQKLQHNETESLSLVLESNEAFDFVEALSTAYNAYDLYSPDELELASRIARLDTFDAALKIADFLFKKSEERWTGRHGKKE